jgi:hypothetical protein
MCAGGAKARSGSLTRMVYTAVPLTRTTWRSAASLNVVVPCLSDSNPDSELEEVELCFGLWDECLLCLCLLPLRFPPCLPCLAWCRLFRFLLDDSELEELELEEEETLGEGERSRRWVLAGGARGSVVAVVGAVLYPARIGATAEVLSIT